MAAQLKVLIICEKWDSGVFPGKGRREELLTKWHAVIECHAEAWPQPSVFAVVVGQWHQDAKGGDTLSFYADAYDCRSGSTFDTQERPRVKRKIKR